ncbi:hypothetical protein [Xylanibacter muris]|nr:hypothetical protein [Xylanibacter muris]
MTMEIIEQALVSKSPKVKPEDGIIITDNFIAVIDGSTSKTDKRFSRWKSNGRYCMQIIGKYISKMPKDIRFEQFVNGVTMAVRKKYKDSQIEYLLAHPEDRLTASCIVFSRVQRQIWMIGDCQCLVGDSYYNNPKPYEEEIANKRAGIIADMLANGHSTVSQLRAHDTARDAVIPDLIATMKNQNITYSVVDGFKIPIDKTHVITLDFKPWTIVLASDGYPFLKPTLKESESFLDSQLREDPLNIHAFKATKAFIEGNNSFDDRAYIRFKI